MNLQFFRNPRVLLAWAFLAIGVSLGWAESAPPVLTSAQQILALSETESGRNHPVRLVGTVTVCDEFWGGEFFLQDATGGIFVDNKSLINHPSPGDVLEVTGVSEPGSFAPIVGRPKWHLIRKSALPQPKQASIDQLMTGAEDGQRVEVAAWVRAFTTDGKRLRLEMVAGADRLYVFLPKELGLIGENFVGCKLRVRGVISAAPLNFSTRRLVTVKMWVAFPSDVIVESSASPDPFLNSPTPVGSLAHYSLENTPGRRSHVRGIVTYASGDLLYISDSSGGLEIRSATASGVMVGDGVDVIGFPTLERGLLILADAVVKRSGKTGKVTPHRLRSMQDVRGGFFHGDLVTIQGRLLNYLQRPLGGDPAVRQVTVVLEAQEIVLTAEVIERDSPANTPRLEIGSMVEVVGICATTVDRLGQFESCRLLLPSLDHLRIVEHASPFTIARLLLALLAVLVVSLAIAVWTVVLSRRNTFLSIEVRERKAILAERTRLAHDLHDTLEQALTGISLQLQTTQRLLINAPERAQTHLAAAAEGVRQSHSELRRSIWNLTPEALERLDLSEALGRTGRSIAEASGLDFEYKLEGEPRPLEPAVEENLLRISQEAITNAVKHAHASRVSLRIAFLPASVILEIEDDGCGFEPKPRVPNQSGGFGISSMRERAGRVGGVLTVESAPSNGCMIRVEVPISLNSQHNKLGGITSIPTS